MSTELSDAQQAVLLADTWLVEACPGAGKTRAIVARFIESTISKDSAVALLSFTNAAVDEAIRRCVNIPQATQAPNFMGTFDRFLRRYIVTPVLTRERGKAPRYVDTWNDLPANAFDTSIRFSNVTGKGLTLANFHAYGDGRLCYPSNEPAAAPQSDRPYVIELGKAGYTPSDLREIAETRVAQLTASGIYDCEQTRLKALSILRDADAMWLHDRLARRFGEIIVDEFQDCSSIEHDILQSLRSFGTRIVVVADPDQAIYEFRQAEPSSYVDYRESLNPDHVVYLDENWRSSPAICAVASSLRSISKRPIVSRRDPSESPHADTIYIAAGKPKYARTEFARLATELHIDENERLVLAATRKAAATLSGRAENAGDATTKTGRVIRSVATIKYSRSARERLTAMSIIEQILLDAIKLPSDLKRAPRQDQLDAAGLSQAQLRVMISRLVDVSGKWDSAEAATDSIRVTVAEVLADVELGHKPPGQQFKSAKSGDVKALTRAGLAAGQLAEITGAHIHSIKGGERDAVLLHIEDEPIGPRPHILDLWASDVTDEARRVLYVGASRARRLLVLAVNPRHLGALQTVLEQANVPFALLVEGD
jgi:DNA helicase-2/ATP-dependent DNA helicase PcrA